MVSSLSFLILITCTFFLFVNLARSLSILLIISKKQLSVFFIFSFFFCFEFHGFLFILVSLCLFCLCFFFWLLKKLVSLIWNFSEFIMHTFNATHSQSTVSRAHQISDMAYNHFTFIQNMSSISWYYSSHGLFRNMLVNFKVFGNFIDIILLLVSCLILL